jgi:AcrR family transcriptional regulator
MNITGTNAKRVKKIDSILKASAQLFATKGYRETTIEDIAQALKATKGSVYYYFGNKADILYSICSAYVDSDQENLEEFLNAIEEPVKKIRFIIFRHIEHYKEDRHAAKTLLNEVYNLGPQPLKEIKAKERRYFQIVRGVLSQWLGTCCREEAVTCLTFTLFGMLNWPYTWYNPKGKVKAKELSEQIYEVFAKGVSSFLLSGKGAGSAADTFKIAVGGQARCEDDDR